MQRVSRADRSVGRPRAKQTAAVGNVQRAVGGPSAPLPAEARDELEDVVVGTSPCRHFPLSTLEGFPQLERLLWPPRS
eukprot:3395097-Prymnesium_polylepis.1